ncbi:MAG: cell division protein FtsQ/DivIB [Lewinellaceae bacterium]|nr:cell division protein FtsQ/DivIB [Lewinellaceae bacterium]
MLRIPNIRYDRLTWVVFILVIVLALLAAISRKKNSFAGGVEVEVVPLASGDKLISERDVKQALLISFGNTLEGTELGQLEVERMERVLEDDPFVFDAEAYIDQRNVLHVKIRQREPVLRILDNNGGNYYLDKDGVKMPPSKNFAAHVLVATGNISPYTPEFQKKKKNTLKDLFTLTQTLQSDVFFASFIQQIHVNNAGEYTLVPLVGDQNIVLGSARKIEDKLNRLKIFYKEGMPYVGWREYESISLKFNGQVVCRK